MKVTLRPADAAGQRRCPDRTGHRRRNGGPWHTGRVSGGPATDPHISSASDVPTWRETTASAEIARVRATPVASVEDLARFRAATFESDEEVEDFATFVGALRAS